jgi:hypothetical protein
MTHSRPQAGSRAEAILWPGIFENLVNNSTSTFSTTSVELRRTKSL